MSTATATATLQDLIGYLDGLSGRASLDELLEMLSHTEIDAADLAEHVHFSADGYTRNLVSTGEWYDLLVLCWKPGQHSPIHDHAGSGCGVRVLHGVMTETEFAPDADGQAKEVGSRDLAAGTVSGCEDLDLHQVSNDQDDDLVTLHIYSPPLRSMGTYRRTTACLARDHSEAEFTTTSRKPSATRRW
jgi:cysteine dioxygenase